MSKQLYFVHTEDDIYELISCLEKNCGKIVINSIIYEPMKMRAQIVSEMTARCNMQYSVVYVPDDSFVKPARYACIREGTAIEMSNCRKWTDGTHTYYDKGRIYLAATESGAYDDYLLGLYKKLCTFFKKKYHYHKHNGLYVSYNFESRYEANQLRISQLGHPLDLKK